MSLSVPRALMWIAMVLAGVVLVLVLFDSGSGKQYTVYATFADADDLLPNNFVKIDGIQAGSIKQVSLNKPENQVIVEMTLDKDAAPIGPGATAAIRPVNLLGEKYLDLTTGNTTKPLPSGSTIPETRTSDPVELDDVFNTLDPDTLAGLQIIVNEAGIALDGKGADFMQTLKELPPTLSAAKQVVSQIADQNQSLHTAIVDGNEVLTSVDSRSNNLQNLITSGKGALEAINTARDNLGSTITAAPGGLAQLRTSLTSLGQAATTLTPAVTDLRQATPSLATTLERLPSFVSDADSTLAEAKTVSPQLIDLAKGSTPILKQLRPTACNLSSFATNVKPLLTSLDQGNSLNDVLGFVNGWADVTQNGDNLGHVFNLRISLDSRSLQSVLSDYTTLLGIGKPTSKPAKTPTKNTPTAPNPVSTVGATVGGVLSGVTSGVTGVVNKVTGTVGQVTGVVNKVTSGLPSTVGGLLNKGSAPQAHTTTTSSGTTTNGVSSLLNYLLKP